MIQARVISPFVERDENGRATGVTVQSGLIVSLDNADFDRLRNAGCVIAVEMQVVEVPENRVTKFRKVRGK